MSTCPSSTRLHSIFAAVIIVAIVTLQCVSARADEQADEEDRDHAGRSQVVLSFSTVGDSRQDPAKPDPTTLPLSGQDAIWLQNTRAWSRIIGSIEDQHPDFLFFNGDMIMGYGKADVPLDTSSVPAIVNSDLMKFYRQYAFWRGMVAGLMENGTYVIPVAGNHEVQCNKAVQPNCVSGKHALAVNENAWRANMGDLILDDQRFLNLFGEQALHKDVGNNGPLDGLTTDQSQLSYSFDFRGSHFVVINTDPVGNDTHAPINWLNADLAAAKTRGVKHFFVFGHKPAYTYYYGTTTPLPSSPSGLDSDQASRDAFWDVIEQYGATYFCGHEHVFNMMQPRAAQHGTAWQILVGSGGSPFEASPTDVTIHPKTDRDYAWARVKVYKHGKVKITAYGFDDQYGPTRVLQSVTLDK